MWGAADEEADDPVRVGDGDPLERRGKVAARQRVILDDEAMRAGGDRFEAGPVGAPGVRDRRARFGILDDSQVAESLQPLE